MIPFALLAGRALLLVLFAALAVAAWGNSYAALAVDTSVGFCWGWCAAFGPPSWADGQHG